MLAAERTYRKSEVIYREGDPSDAVYVVVSGRVELSKQGPEGLVVFARLGPIEMFGEQGILEDEPRDATARATAKTRVKVLPRAEFMVWLQNEPYAGLRVMGLLVDRLRAADAIILWQREVDRIGPSNRPISLVDMLMSWMRRLKIPGRPEAGRSGDPSVQPFLVGVATVNNDIEGAWSRALVSLLENRPGIVARSLTASLQIEPGADQAQAAAAALKARQLLSREENLDLVVWGDVHADGYTLYFSAMGTADDDRPGSFSPYLKLELPGDQEPPAGDLLYLTLLAAVEPLNDAQRIMQRQLMAAAYQALPPLPGSLPVAWNMEQQRTAMICFGHACATIASFETDVVWFDRAGEAYQAALNRLPRGDHGMEEALMRRHLAGVLQAAGDRRQDAALLEQAVGEFRSAVECLVKAVHPQEWAGGQNRLGTALYKLDLMTGQPALLKEAMTAFQAALQVFTRAEAPQRWADVMNNLAQVLQVYGDQVKSPEVLERAIEACRAALEFRPRSRTPLGWAASQNTLGTALFLLDKHSQNTEHLDEADGAFSGALEVYRQFGATRQAAIAEKNLAHLQRLKATRAERKVVLRDWPED